MSYKPDMARIASSIGDPARADMLTALMTGKALTATELSQEAGTSLQTASFHLAKLSGGGLIEQRRQGRHKYFSLANDDVAHALESLVGLAAGSGQLRTRTGPRDEGLRESRVCYNHLAGRMGMRMYDSFIRRGYLRRGASDLALTESGSSFASDFGIDLEALRRRRSPLCRECLDWSERRSHLAGSLGRALLARMVQLGWVTRVPGSRTMRFSGSGQETFNATF